MKNLILSMPVILLLLFSCGNRSSSDNNLAILLNGQVITSNIQNPTTSFADILPDSLSDSAKVEKIKSIIAAIELDSTLELREFKDSLGVLYAFYHDDTLVKITDNLDYYSTLHDISRQTIFYFLKDELICAMLDCSSQIRMGSCGSVKETLHFYYYKQEIITQEYTDISNYGSAIGCSCFGIFKFSLEGSFQHLEPIVLKELQQWKLRLKKFN